MAIRVIDYFPPTNELPSRLASAQSPKKALSTLASHARQWMALRFDLQPVEPAERALLDSVALLGQHRLNAVKHLAGHLRRGKLDEEVRERVQYDGAHSPLLRDLHNRRRRPLGDRLRLRLVALLASREDHQPIAHAHSLGRRVGDCGAAALGRLR